MTTGPSARDLRATLAELAAPLLLFVAAVALQARDLGRAVLPGLDEGVYLYAAKLVAGGAVLYRDFFFSHPPLVILGAAAGLAATGFDVPRFGLLYVAWVFSAVFPLWLLARRIPLSRAAAALAVLLLCVSPVFVGFAARYLAMRQAATPLLAWGLALLLDFRRPLAGGLLLGAFATAVATNAPIAAAILVALVFAAPALGVPKRDVWRAVAACAAVALATALFVLLVPNGYRDTVGVQLHRPYAPGLVERVRLLLSPPVTNDALLWLLGLGGAFFLRRPLLRAVSLPAALVFPAVVFLPHSFYVHYLAAFAFPFALSAAALAERLAGVRPLRRVGAVLLLAAALAAGPIPACLATFRPGGTPEFFRVVDALRRSPGPLLAYEPIYALYAGKTLTPHENVADVRFLRSDARNLDFPVFERLMRTSGTVLVEPYFALLLTPSRRKLLGELYAPVFVEPPCAVFVRRDLLPRAAAAR